MTKAVPLLAGLTGTVWAVIYYLGRSWGATAEERCRAVPGDQLVQHPSIVTDHAIDIGGTPEEVWPWLVQMGWGRGGWYTYRWVDVLLFPANAPSVSTIRPDLQQLAPGDRILDGPPETGCYFTVEELEPNRALVLRSMTHLPPPLLNRHGVALDFSWAFAVTPLESGGTRFHFRSRSNVRPLWLLAAYHLFLVPADFLMARSLCHGLKRRVERVSREVGA